MGELEDLIAAQRAAEAKQAAAAENRMEKDRRLISEFVALMKQHDVPTMPFFTDERRKFTPGRDSRFWGTSSSSETWIDYAGDCWVLSEWEGSYTAVTTDRRAVDLRKAYLESRNTKYHLDPRAQGRMIYIISIRSEDSWIPPKALAEAALRLIGR